MTDLVVSGEDFRRHLAESKVDFILDLRNPDEFSVWQIETDPRVATLNIPQVDFVGEEDKYLDQLPLGKRMIITCAHGDASRYAADILREKGYDATGLAGGMDAWSMLYQTNKLDDGPDIYQIYRIAKGCMTHVLIADGQAVVIDAVRHTKEIKAVIDRAGAKLIHVFDTHLQADHISGGRQLAAEYGAQYSISNLDTEGALYDHGDLTAGQMFRVGGIDITAIHSPGHTPGSMSFLCDNRYLFSGDIIMQSTVGRPDLGGMVGDWSHDLYNTLFERLRDIDDGIIVLPSHAASVMEMDRRGIVQTTMAAARRDLALYQEANEERFCQLVAANLLENPERYQDIRKVNLGIIEADEAKRRELEIGKNLCGMANK